VDALSSVLRSLRLKSTVMSLAVVTGRWGIASPGFERTMIFHGIVAGRCLIKRGGADPVPIEAGEIAFLAHGDAHALLSDRTTEVIPLAQAPVKMAGSVPIIRHGSPGDETRIVCGKCTLDHPASSSVLDLLPAILASRPSDPKRRQWASATLALLEQEVVERGPSARVTSLTDSLFVHLVAETAAAPVPRKGLLAAARDPQIGKALALVHKDPSTPWSASTLAAKVGMGRTRFFDRFTELVGEPPAKYVARWRVLSAADLLRDGSLSTQEIAEKVGYSSEDALARAFKRHMGQRLGQYRRGSASVN
jgi:AraC-like DNA-binding protein